MSVFWLPVPADTLGSAMLPPAKVRHVHSTLNAAADFLHRIRQPSDAVLICSSVPPLPTSPTSAAAATADAMVGANTAAPPDATATASTPEASAAPKSASSGGQRRSGR